MDIYYYIFFISFGLCFFDFVQLKTVRFILYAIFCLFLILIVGYRDVGVDNDSRTYEVMFNFYSQSSNSDIIKGGYGYVEKGYVFINKIIYDLGGSFTNLLFVMAILTGLINYSFFYKKSLFPFISLLFYLSFFYLYRDFTQIRYGLSCAISFWVVYWYINKKYIKTIFLLLLAVLFHNTAFILIPVLLFVSFFKKKILYVLLPIPSFILGITFNPFPLLLKSGFANEHVLLYTNEKGGGSFSISIIGYFIILLYYFLSRDKKDSYINDFYFRIVALGTALNFLFIQSAIFQRFTFLLFQFSIILLPYMIRKIQMTARNKESFMVIYFFMSLFLLLYGIRMIDEELIRPYNLF